MSIKVSDSAGLDPSLFVEPPLLDTAGMLALGRALLYLAPAPPPAMLLPPLLKLRQAWEELNGAGKSTRDSSRPGGRQPIDVLMDNAWTALYERLRAYAMLPESQVPQARRAHDLLRLIFPDGLGFLKLPYEQEWAESGSRLRLCDRLKLDDDLSLLAGREFVTEIRRAHELYGRVLGVDGPTAESVAENNQLRELRASLGRCISHYALKVLNLADDDPSLVRRLLTPLSEHQRSVDRRPSQGRASFRGFTSFDKAKSSGSHRPVPSDRKSDRDLPSSRPATSPPASASQGLKSPLRDSSRFGLPQSGSWPRSPTASGTFGRADPGPSFTTPPVPTQEKPLPTTFQAPSDSGIFRVFKKPKS
jgi:hypothetical protein